MSPDVSVVIPTFNRRDQLERTLAGLAAQTGLEHEFEVIVVSDGSTDGTDEWLRSGATPLPVSACYQSNAGPAAARNRGVAAAQARSCCSSTTTSCPRPTSSAPTSATIAPSTTTS